MIADKSRVAVVITGASVASIALILVGSSSPKRVESPAQRALATWSRSCTAPVDGLCVAQERPAAHHCGPESAQITVVRARSAQGAAAARSALAAAISTYDRSIGGDRHEYAMATLALIDDDLERYLELAGPTGLDFDPANAAKRDASVQRFETWVRTKKELGQRLNDRYEAIAALGDPTAGIVAASRMGTIAAAFAEQLYTMEIPVDVRTGESAEDKIEAFCDTLTTVAEPLEAKATDAFASCVSRVREHAGDANVREIYGVARPCLDALARSRPETYPSLDEVFHVPEAVRMQMQLGVVDNIGVGPEYDQLTTRGVALRIQGDFAGARDAYQRAIALDDARPEAHYDLGLLETLAATTLDLEDAADHYRRSVESFTRASARSNGALRADAMNRIGDSKKIIAQLEAFLAENER